MAYLSVRSFLNWWRWGFTSQITKYNYSLRSNSTKCSRARLACLKAKLCLFDTPRKTSSCLAPSPQYKKPLSGFCIVEMGVSKPRVNDHEQVLLHA